MIYEVISFFTDMLIKFDLIYAEVPQKFTHSTKEVAGKLFESFISMLGKCMMVEEVEYFSSNEKEVENIQEEELQESTSSTSEEEYVPPEKVSYQDRVPFDTKLKIVMTANEHPTWSFHGLQRRFKQHLRHKTDIARFRKDVINGGTYADKLDLVKKCVYDRFSETRAHKQLVTRRQLQQYAMATAMQFRDTDNETEGNVFQFTASASWLTNFIKNYGISNRRVVRYVSKKEIKSPEEISKSAIQFQNLIQVISTDYDSDYIINTDQTGCEYRVNVSRTYTHKGEKTVELFIGDLNKITHSYTAQYSMTKSGKL